MFKTLAQLGLGAKIAVVASSAVLMGFAGVGVKTFADTYWAGHNDVSAINSSLNTLDDMLTTKENKLSSTQADLKQAKTDLTDTQSKLSAAQDELTTMKTALTDAQAQVADLKNQNTVCKTDTTPWLSKRKLKQPVTSSNCRTR
ncbi:hypothetical protein [Lacticaseibacillus hulanensis]|uniref:hypothetical protein n=1 Tax=Lacticaseibacillus hulanensis TaxID=2493111 RepID=UPI000FD7FEC1|nr:hypothetical protein [Lacticaseibacillus hulanensis]